MNTRRVFLRSLSALPIVASAGLSNVLANTGCSESRFGHKFKLSLNAYSFNKPLKSGQIDLFDVLDFCAENDIGAIDPTGYYFPGYPNVPADSYISEFKRKAYLLGIDVSGTGIRNDLSNTDPDVRRRDVELIKNWVATASKMGSPNLRVFARSEEHVGYSRDQVFDWMAKDLKECCAFGKEHGVVIALQNHNNFLRTADDINRLFGMVDSKWLGLNLDYGSLRQGDPYAEVAKCIQWAVTWQIKEKVFIDGEFVPTDFVKLFRIIKESRYRGYLPIETLGAGDPFNKILNLLEGMREALRVVDA